MKWNSRRLHKRLLRTLIFNLCCGFAIGFYAWTTTGPLFLGFIVSFFFLYLFVIKKINKTGLLRLNVQQVHLCAIVGVRNLIVYFCLFADWYFCHELRGLCMIEWNFAPILSWSKVTPQQSRFERVENHSSIDVFNHHFHVFLQLLWVKNSQFLLFTSKCHLLRTTCKHSFRSWVHSSLG